MAGPGSSRPAAAPGHRRSTTAARRPPCQAAPACVPLLLSHPLATSPCVAASDVGSRRRWEAAFPWSPRRPCTSADWPAPTLLLSAPRISRSPTLPGGSCRFRSPPVLPPAPLPRLMTPPHVNLGVQIPELRFAIAATRHSRMSVHVAAVRSRYQCRPRLPGLSAMSAQLRLISVLTEYSTLGVSPGRKPAAEGLAVDLAARASSCQASSAVTPASAVAARVRTRCVPVSRWRRITTSTCRRDRCAHLNPRPNWYEPYACARVCGRHG